MSTLQSSPFATIEIAGQQFQLHTRSRHSISIVRADGEEFTLSLKGSSADYIWIEGRRGGRVFNAVHSLRAPTADPSLVELGVAFRNFVRPSSAMSVDDVSANSWACAGAVAGWGLAFGGLVTLTAASGGVAIFIAVASFELASAGLAACA